MGRPGEAPARSQDVQTFISLVYMAAALATLWQLKTTRKVYIDEKKDASAGGAGIPQSERNACT